MNNTNKFENNLLKILLVLILTFTFAEVIFAIPAMPHRCEPNLECIIGEYVFDDDGYTPITTDNFCQITITDPNDTVIVNNQNMPDKNDGWYYYSTSTLSTPEGLYRSIICCDTGVNRRCLDKTFILGTSFETLPQKIWNYASRTLTSFGSLAADIWSYATRSLSTREIAPGEYIAGVTTPTPVGQVASQTDVQGKWTVYLSDVGEVLAGKTYRAKLWIYDYASQLTDPFATSTVTIYDTSRNIVVNNMAMTKLSTGSYEYTYNVSSSAGAGLWETEVSTEVESGKTIKVNDFWEVEASPAEVKINSITDNIIPSISANITITNEGTAGYEYQYEYCVVDSINNQCGGGDDTAYAFAAKYLNAGQSWTTDLSLTVPNTGTYWYKVYVYWGTEKSVAVRQFDAVEEAAPPPPSGGGGGGAISIPTPTPEVCLGADFNKDDIVNSVDFSIWFYFWRTKPPFKNPCVDINQDNKVDSIDFSILLYQWGKPGIPYKKI